MIIPANRRERLSGSERLFDIESTLVALASRRQVFHSEADFQHEFAWEIRNRYPHLAVRLERPLNDRARGATDIVVISDGRQFGIELKYCTKGTELESDGEVFNLKQQGAHPLRRYDICKDIQRIEDFGKTHQASGAVVVLTNDSAYWNECTRAKVCDPEFRLSNGRQLNGKLDWSSSASKGTKKKREAPITLSGTYQLDWMPYSKVDGKAGLLQTLIIQVSQPT